MMKPKTYLLLLMMLTYVTTCHAWTLQAIDNKNSGIENATLTATSNDGTITGYSVSGSLATFVGAISSHIQVSVPDTLVNGSKTYVVTTCGIRNKAMDFRQVPGLYRLFLPPSVTRVNELPGTLEELFLRGTVKTMYANLNNVNRLSCVYVPPSELDTYLKDAKWANYILIMPEDGSVPLKLNITMTRTGELAQTILEKTDNWLKVKELTVSGPLSKEDLSVVKNMRQLTKLDLSDAITDLIPDNFCGATTTNDNLNGLPILKKLYLPNIGSIGQYAFAQCNKLEEVHFKSLGSIGDGAFSRCALDLYFTIPNDVKSIGASAFLGSKIRHLILPSSITEIPASCFQNCDSIISVVIPSSVVTIGNNAFKNSGLEHVSLSDVQTLGASAFSGCQRLTSASLLSHRLSVINNYTFDGCTMLESIELSGTVNSIGSCAFRNCKALRKLTCHPIFPPRHTSNNMFNGCDVEQLTLYVPDCSIDTYRTDDAWKKCYRVFAQEGKIDMADIYDHLRVDDGGLFDNHCSVILRKSPFHNYSNLQMGRLEHTGNSMLSMDKFIMEHELGYSTNGNDNVLTTLVADGPMRAGEVQVSLSTKSKYLWYFISLPYDANVSDIIYTEDTPFALRTYSGYNRAKGGQNTWLNLTADSVMHANKGYILRCNRDVATFIFKAQNNNQKNNIFIRENVSIPLAEYPSEYSHNRSWNLIGNPYPCYFDIRFMEFSAPITVWDMEKSRYEAFSPIDDRYLLHPTQAFFVQKYVGKDAIIFSKEGRQTDNTLRTLTAQMPVPAHRLSGSEHRHVINVIIKGEGDSDHTRLVFNDQATASYETDKDAAKFTAQGENPLLLYTLGDGVAYAINERPDDGSEVYLGLYIPCDGDYTLSLSEDSDDTMLLTDHQEGVTMELSRAYSFNASKGTYDRRFSLRQGRLDDVTAITEDSSTIRVVGNQMSSDDPFTVYGVNGQLVATSDSRQKVVLTSGVYVVSVNGNKHKIVIR